MPQQAWTEKRERQNEHAQNSVRDQGTSQQIAEQIAARVVDKQRAHEDEASGSARASLRDVSAGERGGRRSTRSAPRGRTRDQLYEEAKALGIPGRSKMDKDELQRAVDRRRGRR